MIARDELPPGRARLPSDLTIGIGGPDDSQPNGFARPRDAPRVERKVTARHGLRRSDIA